ncbi:hypothetical protein PLESTF_001171900 [Pleodorina starrii]|nr:hypothetical protein PLESTF_001171900 [Pleodorina starrii]
MRRMDYTGDAGVAAGQFARSLHDRWGVGDPHCNNGVVLLVSIEDRQIFISAGSGTTSLLTYDVLGDIVNDVRPALKDQRYNEAVERAVVDIGLALAGRPVEPEGGKGRWWEELLGLGIFGSVVCAFIFFATRTEAHKRRRYQDCKAKLEKLKRDQAAIRANTYNPTSCPVCLEDFTETSAGAGTPARTDSAEPAAGSSGAAADAAAGGGGGGDVQMGAAGGSGSGSCPSCASAAKAPSAPMAGGGFNAAPKGQDEEGEELRKPLLGVEGKAAAGGGGAYLGGEAPSAPPLPTQAPPAAEPSQQMPQPQRRPLVLPCGHAFCEPCITQWLEQKKVTCPICRKPFDDEDPATDPRDTTLPRPPRTDPNNRGSAPDAGPSTGAGPSSSYFCGSRPPCSVDDEYGDPAFGGSTMSGVGGSGSGSGAVPRLRLRWGRRRPVRLQEELLLAEMMFRLRQLQRQHPDYISAHMLHAWEQDLQNGREFSAQQLRQFQLNDPATRRELAYQGSSGTGVRFGGGSSHGGGGRGGSW